jgi:glycosyltransferase involved in cell wall biosynthesis
VIDQDHPLVSVILTTRDRPRLLPIALACYRQQTYPQRELIVVDDGDCPADPDAIADAGGRVVRVASGMPTGLKLNRGVEEARGTFCQKMDDDDWYGPSFLATMMGTVQASRADVCRPTLAFLMPFLIFDLARWEVRRSLDSNIPGATLLFERESWKLRPFRALRQNEDVWFYLDSVRHGSMTLPVNAPETFLAIRHHGAGQGRGHTWTHYWTGATIEEHLQDRPL